MKKTNIINFFEWLLIVMVWCVAVFLDLMLKFSRAISKRIVGGKNK